MTFGRNPYVARAQTAEQKAAEAPDDLARRMAHRDAAHQWDRAADREKPGKNKDAYLANAARHRALADGDAPSDPHARATPNEAPDLGEGLLIATSETDRPLPSNPKDWN